jgi:cardiolipin synthase
MDAETVQRASRASWGELLEAGIEIHQYEPTMYHCKVMIVDGLWVSVGSTNFDSRSFALNDEANLNILDAAFASRQIEIFRQDVARSKAISLSDWRRRPIRDKVLDTLASMLRLQL